jgi:hypothetical protein
VNKVGLWNIVSCSLWGAFDDDCSDETLHATNSTGGQFISTGPNTYNLTILSSPIFDSVILRGETQNITLIIGNNNEFAQYANAKCTLVSPSGVEENLTSLCRPVPSRGTLELYMTKIVTDLGRWNVTSCRVYAATSAACNDAILQNWTNTSGGFNVATPTNLTIRRAYGLPSLNSSYMNITVVLENPLEENRYALVACDVKSPSARNFTNSTCIGLNANQAKSINFSLFVDETGIWEIKRCTINSSTSSSCANSEMHGSVQGGTFMVVKRNNLTFANAEIIGTRVFNGTLITARTAIRNPSSTDLFGIVSCKLRTGLVARENSSVCTLFPQSQTIQIDITVNGDVLGTWRGDSCTVAASLDPNCGQAQRHDVIALAGSVNVTTVPDLDIVNVVVPEGINRNTSGLAGVIVKNDGLAIYATATCSIRSPVKTSINSSGCVRLLPGTETIHIPFFVDRLGNWSVFGCFVNGTYNSTCSQSRVHDTWNGTAQFSGTGKTLVIDSMEKPDGDKKVGEKIEVLVWVRNIDVVLHKGFVNCTVRQPNGQLKEITSSIQTIPVDDTRLFKPSFVAELSGEWRMNSCIVYRTESPAYKEDEKTSSEIFVISGGGGVTPADECTNNRDCPGTDLKCFCSAGSCGACPIGTTCKNYICENIVQPQCSASVSCPAGYKCSQGTCVEITSGCTFDSQCPSGQQCNSNGVCVQKNIGCTDDACAPGKCVNGVCEPQAETDLNMIILIIVIIAIIITIILFIIIRRRGISDNIFKEIESERLKRR